MGNDTTPGSSLFSDVETWPCGCPVGMTAHGAGWRNCIFSDEQKAAWSAETRCTCAGAYEFERDCPLHGRFAT